MSDDDAIAQAECAALNGIYIGKKQLEGDFRSILYEKSLP